MDSPSLSAELCAALLRRLRRDYDRENWARFGNQLTAPGLALGDGRATLGRWHPSERRIEISRPLVLEVSWLHVREVLVHEMAHQYVHEVLGVRDESAHGPAFQRVCEQRGIDASATGTPTTNGAPTEEDARIERLREKVRRLLALAGSSNQHEAELAMLRAREILLRHNLEERLHSPQYTVRWIGPAQRRISAARYALAAVLRAHFHVETLWVDTYDVASAEDATVLEITGTPASVEMAEYVHDFLSGTADRLWKEAKPRLGGRARQAFLRGVVSGFAEKLREQRTTLSGTGLVWVPDAGLRDFYERRNPRVVSVGGNRTTQVGALLHGHAAGREIVLHRPLGRQGKGGGRLLGPGE